jgi:lipopolysaccharide biosynthesis glycosyltransferase
MTRTAVFTACDRNYLPGAVAMLGSARRHHPEADRFCMVPDADRAEAERALAGLAAVLTPPRVIPGIVPRLQIANAKVFLSDFRDHRAVAWVDSDMLFCRPAPKLWDVRPGRVVAVTCPPDHRVPRQMPAELRPKFAELFPAVADRPGFNAGLFVLRPADWPDLCGDMAALLARGDWLDHPAYFDQPLWNALFDGKEDLLDFSYNWTEMFDTPPDPATVRLIHFASRPKPWEPGYPTHEPGYWFWVAHGLGETDPARLRAVRRRILWHTPRRRLAQLVRKLRPRVKG